MRRIKASDRPRDVFSGEDIVTWAVRTGRITAAAVDRYRRELETGRITESDVEMLSPVLAGSLVEDVSAKGWPAIRPIANTEHARPLPESAYESVYPSAVPPVQVRDMSPLTHSDYALLFPDE